MRLKCTIIKPASWYQFRVRFLRGTVKPQMRAAHQMRQPMQVPRQQVLVTVPRAENIVGFVDDPALKVETIWKKPFFSEVGL